VLFEEKIIALNNLPIPTRVALIFSKKIIRKLH